MIILAIDTSEPRGSVAVLRDQKALARAAHVDASDYSEWLIPAVEKALERAGVAMEAVDAYGVATGPGSFTGVRVGLTTVKAWCEVYGKPVVGVSRLEALARAAPDEASLLAAWYNAQRGQLFGAIYQRATGRLRRIGDEMVVEPGAFLRLAASEAGGSAMEWISLDPELITRLEGWKDRERRGEGAKRVAADLAEGIGMIAWERGAKGEFTDPLELDANYVRRSDAEMLWKGPAAHGN